MNNQIKQKETYCYYENRKIHIKNPLNLQLQVTVFNITGNVVDIINTNDNEVTHSINLKKGIYLMTIHNNRLSYMSMKFCVQ